MAIEIVDLPIKSGDCPSFFVCWPKGISSFFLHITTGEKWNEEIPFGKG